MACGSDKAQILMCRCSASVPHTDVTDGGAHCCTVLSYNQNSRPGFSCATAISWTMGENFSTGSPP